MTPHDHAREIAQSAGKLLLGLRETARAEGYEQAELRKLGDRGSNELILDALARSYPDDAVLSEEAPDDAVRLSARRVWIVDPLDGTREFGEGRADWAVHVALWEDGEIVAATVALPALDVAYSTGHPLPDVPLHTGPVRIAVSRTRPPAVAEELARRLDGVLVPMGSAGAKAMAVLRGDADVYAHSGGQYEWDSAAPVGVARAAGLHTSRVDGSPLVYNNADPYLPDLLVCRAELAEPVLAALTAGGV
ncbi:MAG: 3'(2'),5'-bisphosphate nucleotidase CysQ [Acidimicrobiia bacterium]|nr:3'(2'),5'-bisphosphate nucleotidase CysQ [Acidimicrobiia bacterium]